MGLQRPIFLSDIPWLRLPERHSRQKPRGTKRREAMPNCLVGRHMADDPKEWDFCSRSLEPAAFPRPLVSLEYTNGPFIPVSVSLVYFLFLFPGQQDGQSLEHRVADERNFTQTPKDIPAILFGFL